METKKRGLNDEVAMQKIKTVHTFVLTKNHQ